MPERQVAPRPTQEYETWETQTPSTVWVYVSDPRTGTYKMQRVGGNGSRRLRITREDREYNQEQFPPETKHRDPFTNGVLAQIVNERKVGNWTDEDLAGMLDLTDEAFAEAIAEVDSELTIRRLEEVCRQSGTVPKHQAITELINERYRVGGTQRTVREMMQAGELAGGEVLSR